MYIKPKTMAWDASPDPDVVSYVVRWSIPPEIINYDPTVNPGVNLGNIPFEPGKFSVSLPIPGMPNIDGQLTIGITAVDDAGNESDPAEGTFPFDFVAPNPPVNLQVI